jgi:RNase P subunit RPR2
MTCQRCDGLMVREQYDNLEFDSAGYEISGWRCLNCGAIVDPVIATPELPPIILTATRGEEMK